MARPRLDDEERRARTVGVRVTAAEAAELRERAQAARLSMGAYLRRRALGQRVRLASERRMISLKNYLEHVTGDDPGKRDRLMKGLDVFLERDRDRELFDLAPNKENSDGNSG